jgi:hypothetical protein
MRQLKRNSLAKRQPAEETHQIVPRSVALERGTVAQRKVGQEKKYSYVKLREG